MSGHAYASAIAGDIRSFVEFKAGVGVGGSTMLWYMRDLDRWCADTGAATLDREAAEGYVAHRLARTSGTSTTWVSYVRELGRWMRLNGSPDAWVLPDGYASRASRSLPYLLSADEVSAFFAAAADYDVPSPMAWQARALFGVMCACGLRTCEARRLRPCDLDLEGRAIDVVGSKCHRSRRLPVTDEVAEMLADSDALTTEAVGADREALFTRGTGRMLASSDVTVAFRRIWDAAGLPVPAEGRRATPYALRHRFAYANIERWHAEGADVMAMLPYLSRYMGHASVDSTMYYVHTSPDFLSGFAAEVSPLDSLLPEVGFDD